MADLDSGTANTLTTNPLARCHAGLTYGHRLRFDLSSKGVTLMPLTGIDLGHKSACKVSR
jgi:hypothetical protein